MGSRMFLLLVLALLIFTDHSRGVPETHDQSLIVNLSSDASDVGEPLTTANPINGPRQNHKQCCKGKGKEMVSCPCQQSARRNNIRHGKMKRKCHKKNNKNLKKCMVVNRNRGNTKKFGPSVPI